MGLCEAVDERERDREEGGRERERTVIFVLYVYGKKGTGRTDNS